MPPDRDPVGRRYAAAIPMTSFTIAEAKFPGKPGVKPRVMPRSSCRAATSRAKKSIQQQKPLRQLTRGSQPRGSVQQQWPLCHLPQGKLLRGSQPRGSVHQRWLPRQPPRGSHPRGSQQPSATSGWLCRRGNTRKRPRSLPIFRGGERQGQESERRGNTQKAPLPTHLSRGRKARPRKRKKR